MGNEASWYASRKWTAKNKWGVNKKKWRDSEKSSRGLFGQESLITVYMAEV